MDNNEKMYCPFCGKELSDADADYCGFCGNHISSILITSKELKEEQNYHEAFRNEIDALEKEAYSPSLTKKKHSLPKPSLKVIIPLAAVLLVAGAVLFLVRHFVIGRNQNGFDSDEIVADTSRVRYDLKQTYGDQAESRTQLYEFYTANGPSLLTIYKDANNVLNYRIYFDLENYENPVEFHYCDLIVTKEETTDRNTILKTVDPVVVRYENYLFANDYRQYDYEDSFVMETKPDGRPVAFRNVSGNSNVLTNCFGLKAADCQLSFADSRISSVAYENDKVTFPVSRKNNILTVSSRNQDGTFTVIETILFDNNGKTYGIERNGADPLSQFHYDSENRIKGFSVETVLYYKGADKPVRKAVEYSYEYGFPYIISETYTSLDNNAVICEATYDEYGYCNHLYRWDESGTVLELEESSTMEYRWNTVRSLWILYGYENGQVSGKTTDEFIYDNEGRPLQSEYIFDPGNQARVVKQYTYTDYDDNNRTAKCVEDQSFQNYALIHNLPGYSEALKQFSNENYTAVIDLLNELLNNGHHDVRYYILRANSWKALASTSNEAAEYWKSMEQDYEQAITLSTDSSVVSMYSKSLLDYAQASLNEGDTERARESIDRSNDLEPSSDKEHRILAIDNGGVWEDNEGNAYDVYGNLVKRTHYDSSGNLVWYQIFSYDKNNLCDQMISYDANGNETGRYTDFTYDENGNEIKGFVYNINSGKPVKYSITSYRQDGSIIESVYYQLNDDSFAGKAVYSYDEVRKRTTGYQIYNENNQRTIYSVYDYDEAGKMIGLSLYNNNGSYIGYEKEE